MEQRILEEGVEELQWVVGVGHQGRLMDPCLELVTVLHHQLADRNTDSTYLGNSDSRRRQHMGLGRHSTPRIEQHNRRLQ